MIRGKPCLEQTSFNQAHLQKYEEARLQLLEVDDLGVRDANHLSNVHTEHQLDHQEL